MDGITDWLRKIILDVSVPFGGMETIRIVNSNICNLDIHDCVDKYNKNVYGVTEIDILNGMVELLVFQKKVGQPNIYTLQEVDKVLARTDNRDVARDIEEALERGISGGDMEEYENIHKSYRDSNRMGNALVSNINLDDHFEWDLSSYSDSIPTRNAVGVYLSELSLPMWIITLHLSTSKEQSLFQLKNLIFRLNNLRDNDLVLVVGDFNINNDPKNNKLLEYDEMIRDFSCSGYEHLKGRANDHVFLRDARKQLTKKTAKMKKPIWEIEDQEVYVTDHRLLIIDLQWPRRRPLVAK